MIIGHLPAGYLLGRAFSRLRLVEDVQPRDLVAASMLGSVFPDLDMIYFHLVDHGRTHHHLCWTHLPSIWIALSSAILFAGAVASRLRPPPAFWFFILGVMSHLVLDSLIGDIYWAIPFDYEPFSMFAVEARHSPWYCNFILHWVFAWNLRWPHAQPPSLTGTSADIAPDRTRCIGNGLLVYPTEKRCKEQCCGSCRQSWPYVFFP